MDWTISTNARRDIWRRLKEFANEEFATDRIEGLHGKSAKQLQNYKKQARQMRVVILQAEEYFSAAAASSTFTSPNHLYYGMVCLASAVMLLRGKGTHSLDYLRRDAKNKHHGLDFSCHVTSEDARRDVRLLKESRVTPRSNGHFVNWQSCLPAFDPAYAKTIQVAVSGMRSSNFSPVGVKDFSVTERETVPLEMFGLMQCLPDIVPYLNRYGLSPAVSRADVSITSDHVQRTRKFEFRLHNAMTEENLDAILEQFMFSSHVNVSRVNCNKAKLSAIIKFDDALETTTLVGFPDLRTDSHGNTLVFGMELKRREAVDAYLSGYCLSMLSRYFPDIWVAFLESHCIGAKLVENFVDCYIDRFPLLALNILSDQYHVFSPSRPIWHA